MAGRAVTQHGLHSPEPSLGPDPKRNAADAQRTATATGTSENGATDELFLEDETPPSEEQKEAVERVMDVSGKNPRVALGVKKSTDYGSPEEDQTEILKAWSKTGMLTHSRYNSHPQAPMAFKRILTIGKHFKISEADRKKLEDWDGKEELPLATMVKDSGANPKEPTKPNDTIQQIYKEAAQHLNKLLIDPVDEPTLGRLRAMNEKIKAQNGKDGVSPAEQWTIDVGKLGAQFNAAKPLYDRLLKDEHDEEAKQGLENIRAEMAKSYSDIFLVPIPTPENRAEKEKADKEARGKTERERLEKEAREKADREAREKAEREKLEKEREEREKGTKFGNIEFPWVTYPLPTGERIIAGRQRTKDDVSGSLCCVELPCTDPEDPNFEFRDDIDIFELQKYFDTPGIKLMGETDEEGRQVKVWRKADRKDFRKFLFCVVGKCQRSDLTKRTLPKCPEALCGFVTTKGIQIGTRSGFKNLVGLKAGDGYIRRYCEKKGITPPWEVEPESYIISKAQKAQLDKTQAGLIAANSGAGYPTPAVNSTSGNSTAGSSDIKLLTERINAMEKQIRAQSNTGGSALDSLLKKMDSMEANVNKRMDAMETKITQVDALTTNMNNLSSVVGLLMQKAGLNAASA